MAARLKPHFWRNRPLLLVNLVGFKRQTRAGRTRAPCPRLLRPRLAPKTHYKGSIFFQKGGSILPGPILATRPARQFWASETLQKRLSNASVTLQKHSTSGLHFLLGVFIHRGRFRGQRARCCGALLACVRVCLGAAVCDR